MEIGKGYPLKNGTDIAVLSLGPIGNNVAEAIREAEKKGISIAHYDMVFLKPLDEELLHDVMKRFNRIVTVEDGALKGGFGSAVLEFMADNGYSPQIRRIGIPDRFIEHGTINQLHQVCEMDVDSIYRTLTSEW